jgi:hypothetical protein
MKLGPYMHYKKQTHVPRLKTDEHMFMTEELLINITEEHILMNISPLGHRNQET